jgi:hypothetical protein
VLLPLVLATVLLPACSTHGLLFMKAERIDIVQPRENSLQRLPLHLAWTAEGVRGRFVLFFDSSPMARGRSLLSLVPKHDLCRASADCPNPKWLSDNHIYVTDTPTLDVETLPDARRNKGAPDEHRVTIVMIDESGRRIDESAYSRYFVVDRTY